mmetsp:Transcript_45125/g.116929  ORF Transcript_45125/g.116929 Transcript_45125/m.116929 type:complete len:267 (+) Transcript_45125:479-1279(+)
MASTAARRSFGRRACARTAAAQKPSPKQRPPSSRELVAPSAAITAKLWPMLVSFWYLLSSSAAARPAAPAGARAADGWVVRGACARSDGASVAACGFPQARPSCSVPKGTGGGSREANDALLLSSPAMMLSGTAQPIGLSTTVSLVGWRTRSWCTCSSMAGPVARVAKMSPSASMSLLSSRIVNAKGAARVLLPHAASLKWASKEACSGADTFAAGFAGGCAGGGSARVPLSRAAVLLSEVVVPEALTSGKLVRARIASAGVMAMA